MTFFLNALVFLALASFTPEASAYIVVVHSGLSDSTRIIIIVVCIVVFLLLLACRIARIRQNRRTAVAATIIPVATPQAPAPNYAGQGPGGYNGYTLPPLQQGQGQYPPPQGYPQNYPQQQNYGQAYAPPAYGPGFGATDAEKGIVGTSPMTDISTNPQQPPYAAYPPPPGPPGAMYAPPPGPPDAAYPPPPGAPPGIYSPPTGYDAAPLSPVPPAHTTVCLPFLTTSPDDD
ncbi:hypothetical protein FB451DRAFT_69654 [Mycena latifolia]|nr:hypothetical protein FB451DRAFT_69654 [Mycena latifolia]